MKEHSPLPWRVKRNRELSNWQVVRPGGVVVCATWCEEDAALIVEAVNANGAWREERRRLQLAAASAEKAFENADARRTLLERYYCEVYADRDRLRDLVRRLCLVIGDANEFATSMATMFPELEDRRAWREMESILREAREALADDSRQGRVAGGYDIRDIGAAIQNARNRPPWRPEGEP